MLDLASRDPPLVPQAAMPVDWVVATGPIAYPEAVAAMEARVAAIGAGAAAERVWLLEHPSLYTAGTSARSEDLLQPDRFPVFRTGRGGQYTYHGPGQRVAYVMLDLGRRGADLRLYVRNLEDWIIDALGFFGVAGKRHEGQIGIWTPTSSGDAKIAAIGVRIRRWVSFHGVAVNVAPDLEHFSGIVPCGLRDSGVTSLAAIGVSISLSDFDVALKRAFEARFAGTRVIRSDES
jgi:lipoyl(octanoyl) transferase